MKNKDINITVEGMKLGSHQKYFTFRINWSVTIRSTTVGFSVILSHFENVKMAKLADYMVLVKLKSRD